MRLSHSQVWTKHEPTATRVGLPHRIGFAAGDKTTNREPSVDTYAPHLVNDSASEKFALSDVVTALLEFLRSQGPHLR